jgi:hypothetical protein
MATLFCALRTVRTSVFCGADSQFKTDNGYVCEEHLLSTSTWNDATRI